MPKKTYIVQLDPKLRYTVQVHASTADKAIKEAISTVCESMDDRSFVIMVTHL